MGLGVYYAFGYLHFSGILPQLLLLLASEFEPFSEILSSCQGFLFRTGELVCAALALGPELVVLINVL